MNIKYEKHNKCLSGFSKRLKFETKKMITSGFNATLINESTLKYLKIMFSMSYSTEKTSKYILLIQLKCSFFNKYLDKKYACFLNSKISLTSLKFSNQDILTYSQTNHIYNKLSNFPIQVITISTAQ